MKKSLHEGPIPRPNSNDNPDHHYYSRSHRIAVNTSFLIYQIKIVKQVSKTSYNNYIFGMTIWRPRSGEDFKI